MLKYSIYTIFLAGLVACSKPADYKDSILQYRQKYKEEFLHDKRSPLTAADTGYLRFYEPDERYKVVAMVQLTPDNHPFEIPTANGKTKTMRQYAVLSFSINDTMVKLAAYQNLKLLQEKEHRYHLFVPFTDATTYTETYGGGRYLDLSTQDIKDGTIEVDFNKCYNPWCAFGEDYSCPIPPVENRLAVSIPAGEKMFAKTIEH